MSGFLRRHDKVVQNSYGKITSPIRCRDTTQEKTKEFISLINRYRRKNTLNKRNTFVFDETIIGDSCRIPLVIGERGKCGGGNINVIRIREKALGCYIPFSMPDGSTPFRVFILRSGSKKECRIHAHYLQPIAERKLRTPPHRLFLQSEKGFLTIGLFKIIMEDFIKWWNRDHKGLHCFLISDNLSIHRNSTITETAFKRGVHMFNIMPGTSHWFQVHDQLPFANLKKLMAQKKNRYSRIFTLPRWRRMALLMGIFYKAERKAFISHIVRKSFADVGLWPGNPDLILENYLKFCPVDSQQEEDETMRDLIDAVNVHRQRQEEWHDKIMSGLEEANVTDVKNYDFEFFREEEDSEDMVD